MSWGTRPIWARKRILGDVADVLAVDGHGTIAGVVEAKQQADNGRLAGTGGSDDAELLPARNAEIQTFDQGPAVVIGEVHGAEADGAVGDGERRGARLVRHLRRQLHQVLDMLEIGQGLADLAIDNAEEIQGLVELQQEGVQQHHVADAQRAGDDALGCHDHQDRDADRDDRGLAAIKVGEADLGADRGLLISCELAVQPLALVALVGEGLDHLVIDQPVDRRGVERVVGGVQLAADDGPPVGGEDGEDGVADDGDEDDAGEARRVVPEQDADDHGELEEGRHQAEERGPEQEGERLDATVDGARQLAGAPLQMVAQREVEEMGIDGERQAPAGPGADASEECVAHLLEERGEEAGGTVADQQCQRDRRDAGLVQGIDRPLEEEGDVERDDLGGEQADEGGDDAAP